MVNRRLVGGALCVVIACLAAPSLDGQQRGSNGEIYRELLPFVGLDGVRLEFLGLGHFIGSDRLPLIKTQEEDLERVAREWTGGEVATNGCQPSWRIHPVVREGARQVGIRRALTARKKKAGEDFSPPACDVA